MKFIGGEKVWNKNCWKWSKLLLMVHLFFILMKSEKWSSYGSKILILTWFFLTLPPSLLRFHEKNQKLEKYLTWIISNNFWFSFFLKNKCGLENFSEQETKRKELSVFYFNNMVDWEVVNTIYMKFLSVSCQQHTMQ